MTRRLPSTIACLFALPLLCAAQPAQPAEGSAPIALQGAGPYHRLTLPAAVYSRSAFSDLRDLRVRNGAGQPVPFAWLQAEASSPRVDSKAVPFFAVPDAPAAGNTDTLLAFKLRPDGSLALATTAPSPASAGTQWLIDASGVQGNLLQARFEVAPGTQGVFAFRLEASDDLKAWRRVGGEQQLVLLEHQQQKLERLAVDLDGMRARFLRLRWADPAHGAVISAVGIDSAQENETSPAPEWSGAIAAERCGTDHCDYRLPRGLPAQSLRLALAGSNTLAPISIAGVFDAAPAATQRPPPRNPLYALHHHRRPAPSSAPDEVPLADTVVYRLTQPGGEARSPDVVLDGAVYPRLRLRTKGPIAQLGATPPTLAVSTTPRTLVFLAQGAAPFSLAWGATGNGGPLALSTLIPGYSASQPVTADGAAVSLVAAQAPAPAIAAAPQETPPRKPWLWAALGGGLLLLGGMAWSLLASLRKGSSEPDIDH